jgi:hypothetical protein
MLNIPFLSALSRPDCVDFEPPVQPMLKGRWTSPLSRTMRRGEANRFAACLCVKHLDSLPVASKWLVVPWLDLLPLHYYYLRSPPLSRRHIPWVLARGVPVFQIGISINYPLNETNQRQSFGTARWSSKMRNSVRCQSLTILNTVTRTILSVL